MQEEVWVRDAYACADPAHKLPIRVINEQPWGNHFAANMLIAPSGEELKNFEPEWLLIQAPSFKADPATDGTRKSNFAVISASLPQYAGRSMGSGCVCLRRSGT